jgi:hypothetical protein
MGVLWDTKSVATRTPANIDRDNGEAGEVYIAAVNIGADQGNKTGSTVLPAPGQPGCSRDRSRHSGQASADPVPGSYSTIPPSIPRTAR